MDDRTLIICGATLCVIGFALAQTLGTPPAGASAPQLATVGGLARPAMVDDVKIPRALAQRIVESRSPDTVQ